MIEPIHRLDLDSAHLAVLQHIERNSVARAPLRPDLAIEIGQVFGQLALDANDHIAALNARPLGRARWRYAANEQPPAHFVGVNTKPWPCRSDRAAGRNQIAENGREAIDWDEHVPWRLVAPTARVADNKRAHSDEFAFAADQRSPAPGRMGRCSKERLVEQIFPAAGKLALGHNIGTSHHTAATEACDEHGIAFLDPGGFAQ